MPATARRSGMLVLASLGCLPVLPGVASAHGVSTSRFQAPLPLSWLLVGAAATVATTALWLGYSRRAVTAPGGERTLVAVPVSALARARLVASGLFFALVVAVLVVGVVGRQVASANLATVATWPVWFRGLAIVAILVGNPWVTLSPWRTLYRALVRLEGQSIALLGDYPRALAAWPAVIGFVVLVGVVENLTILPRSPRLTSVLLAAYATVMLVGALLFGRTWFERADPLGVLYRLLGRVAPIRLSEAEDGDAEDGDAEDGDGGDDPRLLVRPPWAGCLDPVQSVSLVVFAVATVYTVSFDGFTNTRVYQTLLFAVRDALGTGPGTGVLLYAGGLVGFVGTFWLVTGLGDRLGGGTGRDRWARARWFAPTILPIAAGYEIAHNYPYVARNFGRLVEILLDPVVPGVGPIEPLAWLSVPAFWASQVVLVVLGHVVAVMAAHHVARRRYGSLGAARRGHLPLVLLMIGYTVLSLWIVSRPVVAG